MSTTIQSTTIQSIGNRATLAAIKTKHAATRAARSITSQLEGDDGMSTIEYAFGSLAAAALAGVLYLVVNGNGVTNAIESVITDALNNRP